MVNNPPPPAPPQDDPRPHWSTTILGLVFALLGLPLLGLGAWLIVLGGSWYYALAGLGLIVVAALLIKRSLAAFWLYLAVWVATLAWSYWEVGLDWWAHVPRVVAPTVLLVVVILFVPMLGSKPKGER